MPDDTVNKLAKKAADYVEGTDWPLLVRILAHGLIVVAKLWVTKMLDERS